MSTPSTSTRIAVSPDWVTVATTHTTCRDPADTSGNDRESQLPVIREEDVHRVAGDGTRNKQC